MTGGKNPDYGPFYLYPFLSNDSPIDLHTHPPRDSFLSQTISLAIDFKKSHQNTGLQWTITIPYNYGQTCGNPHGFPISSFYQQNLEIIHTYTFTTRILVRYIFFCLLCGLTMYVCPVSHTYSVGQKQDTLFYSL